MPVRYVCSRTNHTSGHLLTTRQNVKSIRMSARTHMSTVQMYNAFYCGFSLLQCLAAKPDALPFHRVLRSINACSSTLTLYTSSLETASQVVRLFDQLCDKVFGEDDDSTTHAPSPDSEQILQKIAKCDPLEASM